MYVYVTYAWANKTKEISVTIATKVITSMAFASKRAGGDDSLKLSWLTHTHTHQTFEELYNNARAAPWHLNYPQMPCFSKTPPAPELSQHKWFATWQGHLPLHRCCLSPAESVATERG